MGKSFANGQGWTSELGRLGRVGAAFKGALQGVVAFVWISLVLSMTADSPESSCRFVNYAEATFGRLYGWFSSRKGILPRTLTPADAQEIDGCPHRHGFSREERSERGIGGEAGARGVGGTSATAEVDARLSLVSESVCHGVSSPRGDVRGIYRRTLIHSCIFFRHARPCVSLLISSPGRRGKGRPSDSARRKQRERKKERKRKSSLIKTTRGKFC